MSGNLYTATESLLRAYQSIIDENDISTFSFDVNGEVNELKTGIPDRMEFYRQQFGGRDLTVAERLLSYVRKGGDEFATKQADKSIAIEQEVKDKAAADYILDGVLSNLKPLDVSAGKLTDAEIDELRTSINTLESELPEIDNPFIDNDSHNRKPLEPNRNSTE